MDKDDINNNNINNYKKNKPLGLLTKFKKEKLQGEVQDRVYF